MSCLVLAAEADSKAGHVFEPVSGIHVDCAMAAGANERAVRNSDFTFSPFRRLARDCVALGICDSASAISSRSPLRSWPNIAVSSKLVVRVMVCVHWFRECITTF